MDEERSQNSKYTTLLLANKDGQINSLKDLNSALKSDISNLISKNNHLEERIKSLESSLGEAMAEIEAGRRRVNLLLDTRLDPGDTGD